MLLAACASEPSGLPGRSSTEGDVQHHPLALGQISTGAVPHDHPAPMYPASLRASRLPPQQVSARLIVDPAGKVSAVRIENEVQADARQQLFNEAVRTAAMQWTFEPLRVSRWAADANGNAHEVSTETRAFSVNYVFRFALNDGMPVTDASATP